MNPSKYCNPAADLHTRREVITGAIGECQVCHWKREYPQLLKSVRPDQFVDDAHADNVGRKRDAAHVGFAERKRRR